MTWRKKGIPLPEESRYDRMDSPALFTMVEGSLSMATHLVDVYRQSPEPAKELSLLQTELEGVLAATQSSAPQGGVERTRIW